MASSNSGVQQQHYQQQQQQQQINSQYSCKDCNLFFNSAESLEVHFQYHNNKEFLLSKWASQAASAQEETNNNNTKGNNLKREFISSNTIAAADSSDSMNNKKSPEYNSTNTPETNFGHPPTPQSYQSASSPYQNPDTSAFSPNFQNYQIKPERHSPNTNPQQQHYTNNYNNYSNSTQYFATMETSNNQTQQYNTQEFSVHKNTFRFHPYQQSQHSTYDRTQSNSQVSSSSPAYPPQPTPSPSPKQCDKCGFVCESAAQLFEHISYEHPPTPASHLSSYHHTNQFLYSESHPQIKTEDDAQSEILDLDSHKVHQVYPEDEKRQNGDLNNHNPHSVSAMLNSWSNTTQQQQQKMYQQQQEQRLFINSPADQKIFTANIPNNIAENKMFSPEQKLFQPHSIHNPEFLGNGVTTTTQENNMNSIVQQPPQQGYRAFEHLPSQNPTPVISSTQVPNNPPQTTPSPSTKSTSWKSNEARRPKTYNCTACNKWFTSSGHLKRHYNTTLHKNAVKSSGQPDPASLPISAHHHPARDSTSREDHSSSPGDESRSDDTNSMPPQFERTNSLPTLLQQPPNGPYDRQPPQQNIHHPPPLHSPIMAHNSMGNNLTNPSNLANLSNVNSPNGEAGLSPTNLDSRGLLSLNSTPNTTPLHGFNMAPLAMMPIENTQYQMYPNELAPHVTQATVINNLNITGEYPHQFETVNFNEELQPLPSFAQIQPPRLISLNYINANVGGGGSVTTPSYINTPFELVVYKTNIDDDYKNQLELTENCTDPLADEEFYMPNSPPHDHSSKTSPTNINNNNNNINTINNNMNNENILILQNEERMKREIFSSNNNNSNTHNNNLVNKIHIKRDFEESTGSPLISSTVQTKQAGLHRCHDCDKHFNKACYLTQHNKTFHSGDKPFKCTRCGKRFSNDITYQEHLKKHAGDKPHKCDQCPKQFNHKTDLRRHMCLHSGKKPYSCDTCGKGFIRKDHMLKHCETHNRKHKVVALR